MEHISIMATRSKMASSKMKFTYFDGRGMGEIVRLEFAFAGKKLDERRIPYDREKWFAEIKKTIWPFQQVPIMEIDGEIYPQSNAIAAFVAKEFGLYPKTNKEQLIVDVVMDTRMDIFKAQSKWFYLSDGPKKEELRKASPKETAKFFEHYEYLLGKNKTGYFVGNNITLADLCVFDILTGYLGLSIEFSDEKYPNIAKNRDNVLKNKNIADYVAKRPYSAI